MNREQDLPAARNGPFRGTKNAEERVLGVRFSCGWSGNYVAEAPSNTIARRIADCSRGILINVFPKHYYSIKKIQRLLVKPLVRVHQPIERLHAPTAKM